MKKPYYLFKRRISPAWYVKFRDVKTGIILPGRSTGHTNKTRADAWAREQLEILLKPASGITFLEYAKPFFTDECPRSIRRATEGKAYSPRTTKEYLYWKDKAILTDDTLCSIPISEIRRHNIIAFRSRLLTQYGACAAVNKTMDALRAIFAEAEYLELIEYNPVSKVKMVVYERRETPLLTIQEVKSLLNPEYYEEYRYFLAVAIVAYTGLRASEVRALQWLDLEPDRIHVQRAWKDRGTVIGTPKNGFDRYAALPSRLDSLIIKDRLKHSQKADMWIVGLGPLRPLGYKKLHDQLQSAAKGVQVKVTLHALRHSLHTALRGFGVRDELLRAHFGWTGQGIQENYTHRIQYDLTPVAEAVDTLFGGL